MEFGHPSLLAGQMSQSMRPVFQQGSLSWCLTGRIVAESRRLADNTELILGRVYELLSY